MLELAKGFEPLTL